MDSIGEAYREKKKWEEAMGVGTMDKMFDVLTGKKIDYNSADYLGLPEPEDHHIDYSSLGTKVGMVEETSHLADSSPIDPSYLNAIKKYPSIVTMLGDDLTGELGDIVGEAINEWIIKKIAINSQKINKNAIQCKTEDGFVKQYFKYENQLGFVKAAGKFTGNEYIHYDAKKKEGYVLLRKSDNKFENISNKFNVEPCFVEI